MQRILITGENSYIGTSLEKWLQKEPEKYHVDTISVRGDSWKSKDFSTYDVVFHVAGIAHVKETKQNRNLYYEVNRDLAYAVAKKSKKDDVNQFIFLSSMSVYGLETGIIDENTPTKPKSAYGNSKLEAEQLINGLIEDTFKVAIIRPPMVYGKNCKGNYPKLSNLARKTPIFPDINNRRSMIYIDNLSEFIKYTIDGTIKGLFLPQNSEYVNTSEMVKMIGDIYNKNIYLTHIFNPFIRMMRFDMLSKVFGNLVYDKKVSHYEKDYRIFDFFESIKATEE